MSIVTWIVVGAVVGLSGAHLRPGRFPGDPLGAAVTGAVGGFVGGRVLAALDDRALSGLDATTAVSAIVGAGMMLTAMHRAAYVEPRPD